jgi:hypothetical protein
VTQSAEALTIAKECLAKRNGLGVLFYSLSNATPAPPAIKG